MRSSHLSLKERIQQNHSGFTLTETMVVVSVIGILSVAAIGSFVAMRPTRNMHSYGRDLIAAAQGARLEAVKRNTCVGIDFQWAAVPPADLTGVANRGSYRIFTDDGRVGGNACNAIADAGELANPQFPPRTLAVPDGVALTQSPVVATVGVDPAMRVGGTDLFGAISFNSRSLVAATVATPGGRAIVIRNDPNPANATWWGRVVVNSLGGSMEYQTNNDPVVNEGSWSE